MLWRGNDLGLFILGTVQLGLPYGIANVLGKPARQEAQEMVDTALAGGVLVFDTAQAYGDSEFVLGDVLCDLGVSEDVLLMTKAHVGACSSVLQSRAVLADSLRRLKVEKVFALLEHSFSSDSLVQERLSECFKDLKAQGLVCYTGVSVYSGQEAMSALALPEIDIVQMPLNVLDRQAVSEKVIERARAMDKLLVFRSVYLQGLLTMPAESLPEHMLFAGQTISAWQQICADLDLVPGLAALAAARRLSSGFPLVIGAEKTSQVRDNIAGIKANVQAVDELIERTAPLSLRLEERLRNPALWSAAVPVESAVCAASAAIAED